jgi:hypothetical protein
MAALRNGWEVSDANKPGLVDEFIAIVKNPEMPAKAKIAAFNALRMADKDQYERDQLEEAGIRIVEVPSTTAQM